MKITTVAKHYFSHPSIWLYIIIALALGVLSIVKGYFEANWYSFIIIILLAPFFEWFVHKYILHFQIGNIVEVENKGNQKIGDKISLLINGAQKSLKIIDIKENTIIAGYGLAKNKFVREYMQRLHFGHHAHPETIHLVFAQTSAALLIFIGFFAITLLFTSSIAFAVVFTFYVVLYYLHYEWMHLAHHIPGYKHFFPWSNKLKTAHLLHHYSNENYWWGITNNLGDLILGTFPKKNEIGASKTVRNINHEPNSVEVL